MTGRPHATGCSSSRADLLDRPALPPAPADAGDLDADGKARLDALLAEGRAQFDAEQYVTAASTFRVLAGAAAEEAASAEAGEPLVAKAEELVAWAKGLR